MPPEILHSYVHAPSRGLVFIEFNMPFELILRRFEVF